MHKPALTKDEKILLQNHFQKSPICLIRVKAQAMLMIDKGLKQDIIGELLGKNIRSIQRYASQFCTYRMASLFSGHVENENASKLTIEQKKEVRKVLSDPPSKYGLPKEFWDVPQLKEYVKAEFKVEYESNQSYHYLLKFSGLRFKYPDRFSPRRDEDQIKQRIIEIREEIKPMMSDGDWVVYAADETRLQLEAEIRRAWLQKNKKTIVKTERSLEHQNYFGVLDQKSGECQVFEIERGNQEETIKVLESLIRQHPGKRVCLVWDNASWHKGNKLKEKLKVGESLENLHLIAFPPYAPETNPIEHVWQYGKSKIANKQESTFEITKNAFLSIINSKEFCYKI